MTNIYYKGQLAHYTGRKSYETGVKGPTGWYYEIEVVEGDDTGKVTWTRVKPC